MDTKTPLAKNIAGEITISSKPSSTIKKWREIFQLSQTELAKAMGIYPSVISDYESGRRKSPGASFIKNMVESLIEKDYERGGEIIKRLNIEKQPDAILDLKEFTKVRPVSTILKKIDAQIVGKKKASRISVKGYTVIDSIKAIIELSEGELREIYGSTSERALIFTKVHTGRSPLIAVKVTKPKPNIIILHGLRPSKVDKLAIKIADSEKIPLAVSRIKSEEDLIENLGKIK